MVNLSRDHIHKMKDLSRDHVHKVMGLSRDHLHKVMDLRRDHLHKVMDLSKDHLQKVMDLSKDHLQKVMDLSRDHIHKVKDLRRDHLHKVIDLSKDHLHEIVNLCRDQSHQSNIVITILLHLFLRDITDHHPQDMAHKDLPKSHQPSNLEFIDRYDSSSLSIKVLTPTSLTLYYVIESTENMWKLPILGLQSKYFCSDILE